MYWFMGGQGSNFNDYFTQRANPPSFFTRMNRNGTQASVHFFTRANASDLPEDLLSQLTAALDNMRAAASGKIGIDLENPHVISSAF
jgi:hypothetical protein